MESYIEQLRKQLEKAKEMLELSQKEYEAEQDDFSLKLTVATYTKLVNKLSSQVETHEVFEKGLALLINNGDLLQAKEHILTAIGSMPSYLGVLNNVLLQRYKVTKDWEEAIRTFEFILDIKPDYEVARNNLAMLFVNYGVWLWEKTPVPMKSANLGSFDMAAIQPHMMALSYLRNALSISTDEEVLKYAKQNLAAAHIQLAKWSYDKDDMQKALMFIETSLSYKTSDQIRRFIGELYAEQASKSLEKGYYEQASLHFQMAENSGFIVAEVYNDHGVALAKASQFEEAIFKLARATELDPENITIRSNFNLAKKHSNNFEITFKMVPHFDAKMSYSENFHVADAA
jgi:tetratricopeptide (TPR) repeat protein